MSVGLPTTRSIPPKTRRRERGGRGGRALNASNPLGPAHLGVGHEAQQLVGVARLGETDQQVLLGEDADVAVQRVGGRQVQRLCARGHQGLADFLGDEPALAHARTHDGPRTPQTSLRGGARRKRGSGTGSVAVLDQRRCGAPADGIRPLAHKNTAGPPAHLDKLLQGRIVQVGEEMVQVPGTGAERLERGVRPCAIRAGTGAGGREAAGGGTPKGFLKGGAGAPRHGQGPDTPVLFRYSTTACLT